MKDIKIEDRADEFRISLKGRFDGPAVFEVRKTWTEKLAECLPRRFTVDISALTDYDAAGRKLLRDMYHHGIHFAAATPGSLVLLSEISSPKRWSITMLPDAQTDRNVAKPPASAGAPAEGKSDVDRRRTRAAGK